MRLLKKHQVKIIRALEGVEVLHLFYARKEPTKHNKQCTLLAHPEYPANKYHNQWCEKCQYETLRKAAHQVDLDVKAALSEFKGT